MTLPSRPSIQLLVLDIDNTVFDWVTYYVHAFSAMLRKVESTIGVAYEVLAKEAQAIFLAHGSIEYPFVVQEMPSVNAYYGLDLDRMLEELIEPVRLLFKAKAVEYLVPYEGVQETLAQLRRRFPDIPIVALTDAPRYVAMWKLRKLGLLEMFAAVYGLVDPRLPTCDRLGRVKVNSKILLKHLQQSNFGYAGKIRILPEDYEKPGVRGLKTVLMDYEMDEPAAMRQHVLWVGDNLRKDVALGRKLGVQTAWAAYGAEVDSGLLARLQAFSPAENVHKNANLPLEHPERPSPDLMLCNFTDLLAYFN